MRSRFCISQSSDNVTQSTERLIDFLTLFEPLASSLGDSYSLTSRQIDQIQFSHLNLLGTIFTLVLVTSTQNCHLFHNNDKDCMRS